MACEVTYKGTKYSRNEFIELLYNGELDKLMPKLDQRYFVGTYAPEVKKDNPLQDVESTAKALEGITEKKISEKINQAYLDYAKKVQSLKDKINNLRKQEGDSDRVEKMMEDFFNMRDIERQLKTLSEQGALNMTVEETDRFLDDIKSGLGKTKYIRGKIIGKNNELGDLFAAEGDGVLYRSVTLDDWGRIQKQGFVDSDKRGAISEQEGTNLAIDPRTSLYYLPHNQKGVIIAIDPKGVDLFMIKNDDYLRTNSIIPISNVVKVSEVIGAGDISGNYLPSKGNRQLSEAYHKAKSDGTNPELVEAVEELLKETPQAGSVLGGDVDLTMVEYAQRYPKTHEVVFVDPSKVLERLAKDDPNYDVQNKKNQIGNRVQKAKDFILNYAKDRRWINHKTGVRSESTNAIFEPSIAQINNGKISFEDGRHRILAAKELGITKVAIEVPKEQVNQFKKYFEAVKEIDSVNKAEQRLKDAWNNFKNSGIAADKFEEIKREVELVKALFDYAWKKGLQTAKDVYDYVVGAISGISDAQAKRLSNKVEGLLNNPSGLVDEVLDMYAPIVAEQGLELSDVKQFMDDTFYKGGKFDAKAANEWLKNETADIDEQEKRLWSDLISAATQQENTIGTPRPQPQAPPQQAAPQPQATTETQNIEWLNSLLGSSVTKENFPVILFDEKNEGGVEKKRISAGTQEEVFERKIEEDASYISVTIQTLGEIAQDDAKAALDKFGKNWIGTMLSAFESGKMNMSTMVRAIGLLSYISNDLNNKITSGTSSRAELDALLALQRRADALSIKFSSWASLGLNARRILRKFAMGEIAMNDLSARVIGDDVARMVEAVERIMQEQESNEDLNAATAPIPKARKKRSVVNRVVSAIKPKSGKKASAPKATAQDRQNIINDAIAEKRKQGMEGVSRQDLLNSIRERINKCK